ncbi:MAG: hypothetical protein IPJ32_20020 [Sphingobacteriaceae bacterium]|nr:hypothetical protein [Sphingobacteriaceae bacterium]
MRNQSWKNEIAAPVASTSAPVNFPTKSNVVEDKASHSSSFIGIGVGMEKHKGKTRLQGFYGADVFVWFSSSKDKFKYGNSLTQGATTDPNVGVGNSTDWSTIAPSVYTTSNWDNTAPTISGYSNITGWRKVSEKPGGQFGLGVRAFIGAEYFVMPKNFYRW